MFSYSPQQVHHAILIHVKTKGSAMQVVEDIHVPVRRATPVLGVEQVSCKIF